LTLLNVHNPYEAQNLAFLAGFYPHFVEVFVELGKAADEFIASGDSFEW